jgi:hypothetical protein
VVALEEAHGGEVDRVPIAGVVGREQREVSIPLRLSAGVVGDVDLAAENRLDPLLAPSR